MKTKKILSMVCVLVSLVSVCAFAGGSGGDVQYQGEIYTGKGTVPTDNAPYEEISYTGKIVYYKDCNEAKTECTISVSGNGQGSVKINHVKIDYTGQLTYSQHYNKIEGIVYMPNNICAKIIYLDVTDSVFTDGDGSYNLNWRPYTDQEVMSDFTLEHKGIEYSCDAVGNCINIDYVNDVLSGTTSIPYSGQLIGSGAYKVFLYQEFFTCVP